MSIKKLKNDKSGKQEEEVQTSSLENPLPKAEFSGGEFEQDRSKEV